MDKSNLYRIAEKMRNCLGNDILLDALVRSLSSDELEDHLRYIDRMYETNCF